LSESSGREIKVTQPLLPDLDDMDRMLEKIWESRQLSNNGEMVQRLEAELSRYLDAEAVSVFSNGTAALQIACRLLGLDGEVITTPFTFAATVNAIQWNHAVPVFCDIQEDTCNMDPRRIEPLITEKTSAILPVHVFGNPCDVDAIGDIADRHGLKVLYDAAHAFGVRYRGKSLASFGDVAMLSFHATKVFNTIEGGALVFSDPALKRKADELRNFGLCGDGDIREPGINGKMNEVQAAMGLLLLKKVGAEIERRKTITQLYAERLEDIPGVRLLHPARDVDYNYPYLIVRISEGEFGCSRDALYERLAERSIFTRKYFYPLCSNFSCYRRLSSSEKENLPVANRIADSVLALPLYGALSNPDVELICDQVEQARR